MANDNYGTWLEIDLKVLENNFRVINEIARCKVMPVVKANAYGHGLEKVTQRLEKTGAEWFGVARIEEGLLLREAGVKARILVLGYTAPVRVPHAIRNDVTLTVYDYQVAEQYATQAKNVKGVLRLHAKIDTGMGRLGIPPQDALPFLKLINESAHIELEGVFTHFARADEPGKEDTSLQLKRFQTLLKEIEAVGIKPLLIHASNSAGALIYPDARFNLVRVGIALYGLPPSDQVRLPDGVTPALSWKTRLISIKTLPAGHGVSYGFKYYTKKEERIGVIAVGYADGLRRRPGNKVLVRGKRANVIGNVCMDQCMLQLDEVLEAEIGDEVVLIGGQGDNEITATEIAVDWGTINYEVVCGLASRMPRVYLK
ncbi:MAG: alanine racemase [Anaerolineaceae bacterium]|nr:alanine racemase [Anaerolineaceae bacterium]